MTSAALFLSFGKPVWHTTWLEAIGKEGVCVYVSDQTLDRTRIQVLTWVSGVNRKSRWRYVSAIQQHTEHAEKAFGRLTIEEANGIFMKNKTHSCGRPAFVTDGKEAASPPSPPPRNTQALSASSLPYQDPPHPLRQVCHVQPLVRRDAPPGHERVDPRLLCSLLSLGA